MASLAERIKVANSLGKSLEKTYGENTLLRLGDRPKVNVAVIPTHLVHFDHEAIGCGGIPRGRVIEIFGPESAGKTSLTLHIIAECQKAGGLAAYIDAEHALDPTHATNLGVDADNLFLNQPTTAEEGLNIVNDLVKSNVFDIVAVDTVAALTAKAELEGQIGDAHVGLLPRLMAQTLRIITGKMNEGSSKTTVIFLNQIREKIGVMYGNPETQPGGRALKFYASVRMDVRRTAWIPASGENPIGQTLKVKFIKNKVAAPFRTTLIDLYYQGGFDKKAQTLDLAFERNVLYKEGTGTKFFIDLPGKKGVEKTEVAVGKEKTKLAVLEDPDLYAAVERAVIDKLKGAAT